jgi:hypothetical protein
MVSGCAQTQAGRVALVVAVAGPATMASSVRAVRRGIGQSWLLRKIAARTLAAALLRKT